MSEQIHATRSSDEYLNYGTNTVFIFTEVSEECIHGNKKNMKLKSSTCYELIQTKLRLRSAQHFKNKPILNKLDAESSDPNHNYEILKVALREPHNDYFPTLTVRFNEKRHKKTAWITNGIIKSTNHRNNLY